MRRPSNASGSPSAWRSQSTTTCSSSVPLGDVRQSIGFWPSAAVSISPRIPARTRSRRSRRGSPGAASAVAFGSISREVVGEDRVERLGVARAAGRQAAPRRAGRDRRAGRRTLDAGEVIGHQVDDPVGGRRGTPPVDMSPISPGLLGRGCRRTLALRWSPSRNRTAVERDEAPRLGGLVAGPRSPVCFGSTRDRQGRRMPWYRWIRPDRAPGSPPIATQSPLRVAEDERLAVAGHGPDLHQRPLPGPHRRPLARPRADRFPRPVSRAWLEPP